MVLEQRLLLLSVLDHPARLDLVRHPAPLLEEVQERRYVGLRLPGQRLAGVHLDDVLHLRDPDIVGAHSTLGVLQV